MFTSMYNKLNALNHFSEDSNIEMLSTSVELARRNIELFLFQLDRVNELAGTATDKPAPFSEDSFKLLPILDKHLNGLITLSIESCFNKITRHKYSEEKISKKQSYRTHINNIHVINKQKMNQINALRCLFTWNISSEKDMITFIKKKYGDYNIDISQPVFIFERYISNIIISYELYLIGKKETAELVIILIGNWLEKLDDCVDEFYLSISNGLKYILTSMLIHMNLNNDNQSVLKTIKPFSKMKPKSKAAIYATEAAVLIEYGGNKDYFERAEECSQKACDLNPSNSYWFYLHAIVLRTRRHFLQSFKSCPTDNEINAIEQSIMLSDVQNLFIRYHEIILFKETTLYNFHNKKNVLSTNIFRDDFYKVVNMIKLLSVDMEPNCPLIFVHCARILISLPTIVNDFNLANQFLMKGLRIAPNDLIVLQAILKVIILMGKKMIKNIKSNSSVHQFKDQLLRTKNKRILSVDLNLAIGIHNRGEDPIPYLIGVLDNYDCQTRWKIMAQICSYTILFCNNLKDGVNYFMMLVKAQELGTITSDLILCHFSSFSNTRKEFNLAELIRKKIKLALSDRIHQGLDDQYYKNVLDKIMSMYQLEAEDFEDNFVSSKLSRGYKNNDSVLIQNVLQFNSNSTVVQNNSNDDSSIISIPISDSSNDDNTCCRCRIM